MAALWSSFFCAPEKTERKKASRCRLGINVQQADLQSCRAILFRANRCFTGGGATGIFCLRCRHLHKSYRMESWLANTDAHVISVSAEPQTTINEHQEQVVSRKCI